MKRILVYLISAILGFSVSFAGMRVFANNANEVNITSEEMAMEIIANGGVVSMAEENAFQQEIENSSEKEIIEENNSKKEDKPADKDDSSDSLINYDFDINEISINGISLKDANAQKVLESFGQNDNQEIKNPIDLGDGFTLSSQIIKYTSIDDSYEEMTVFINHGSSWIQYSYSDENGHRLTIFRGDSSEEYVDFSKFINVPFMLGDSGYREFIKSGEVKDKVKDFDFIDVGDFPAGHLTNNVYSFESNLGSTSLVVMDYGNNTEEVLYFNNDEYWFSISEAPEPEQISYNLKFYN